MKLSSQFLREVVFKRDQFPQEKVYPWNLPVLKSLKRLPLHPQMTFFVGDNGSGKSTVLEAIAVAAGFNPEGGTLNTRFTTRDSHSELHAKLTLVRGTRRPREGFFMRSESLYTLSTWLEQDPIILGWHGGQSFHTMSHGEAFLRLLERKFNGDGLYLMDEPEAALSPLRQLVFLNGLHRVMRTGAQCIVATHSPILMAYPNAQILLFGDGGVERVAYEETEHYVVARRFFADPRMAIDEALKDVE